MSKSEQYEIYKNEVIDSFGTNAKLTSFNDYMDSLKDEVATTLSVPSKFLGQNETAIMATKTNE